MSKKYFKLLQPGNWVINDLAISFFKTIIFFSIFLIPVLILPQSQRTASKNIDLLLKNADNYINIDFLKVLQYAKKASIQAEAVNNSEKKAESYYYIARSLIVFKKHKESFFYIEKGLKEPATKQNTFLMAAFMDLKGINYSKLYLLNQQIREIEKIPPLLTSLKEINAKVLLANVYTAIADYYTETNNLHLANIYADSAIRSIEMISIRDYIKANKVYRKKANIYYYKAVILFNENKLDSTRYYMEKAYAEAISDNNVYLSAFLALYGDYYFKKKDYPKALKYYLRVMEIKKKAKDYSADINKKISKLYNILGDYKNEKLYLEKSFDDLATIHNDNQKDVQAFIQSTLNNEANSNVNKPNKSLLNIFLIFTFVMTFSYISIKIYRTNQKKTFNKISSHLAEQSKIFYINEQKIEVLEQKLNHSFPELVEMAKKNNPQFWARFQEVYPHFRKNLIGLNTNMKISELTLCAYVYFGFTSKEIADYTFKSVKTIDNNRHNLRKKLQLAPETDFVAWLNNMVHN